MPLLPIDWLNTIIIHLEALQTHIRKDLTVSSQKLDGHRYRWRILEADMCYVNNETYWLLRKYLSKVKTLLYFEVRDLLMIPLL